jgi:HigB_toxin, RelE-like toxic component of a toxin-antitoxin system
VIKHVGTRCPRATCRLDVGSGAEMPVGASNGFANFFAPNSALFRKDCFGLWQTITPKRKRAHFDAGTLIDNPRLPANSALKAAVDAWFDEAKKARRSSAADVKRSYATASIVSVDRLVFNIKGNDYRLVLARTSTRASSGSNGSARKGLRQH